MSTRIIAIVGPTAVGKTDFAIDMSVALGGEIISCDSMQIYKYMDIGSAKPSPAELAMVRHHMVDIVDPREDFSVAKYAQMAREAIRDVADAGRIPIVSGGTGLYLDSLIYDMDFAAPPGADMGESREKWYNIAEEQGVMAVYDVLAGMDKEAAARIHPNNLKKVIRAIESAENGEKIKDFATDLKVNEDFDFILVALTRDRAELYDRIDRRVDQLMEAGLLEEVRMLLQMGLSESDISMKGIGYKELFGYLHGEYDIREAVRLIKRNTRHYAKRQLTWFRRYDEMKWFDISGFDSEEACKEAMLKWLKKSLNG